MDTLAVVVIGVVLLLAFDAYFIFRIRKKRQSSFKLVIEKGVITESNGNIPAEFLYDMQQLARMTKPESLIINGSGLSGNTPKLEFKGHIDAELQEKIEHSLFLSRQ